MNIHSICTTICGQLVLVNLIYDNKINILHPNEHCVLTDMQHVEILLPADFEVKMSAQGQNQTPLIEHMNVHQFS